MPNDNLIFNEEIMSFVEYCQNTHNTKIDMRNFFEINAIPDCEKIDLSNRHLAHVNFSKAIFSKATFTKSNLNHANFNKANCTKANFTEADLLGTEFKETILIGACFTNAKNIFPKQLAGAKDISSIKADDNDNQRVISAALKNVQSNWYENLINEIALGDNAKNELENHIISRENEKMDKIEKSIDTILTKPLNNSLEFFFNRESFEESYNSFLGAEPLKQYMTRKILPKLQGNINKVHQQLKRADDFKESLLHLLAIIESNCDTERFPEQFKLIEYQIDLMIIRGLLRQIITQCAALKQSLQQPAIAQQTQEESLNDAKNWKLEVALMDEIKQLVENEFLAQKFNQLLQEMGECLNECNCPVPKGCYIAYGWCLNENAKREHWIKDFLRVLKKHLEKAGITTVRLDIDSNPMGGNIQTDYMSQIQTDDYVLMIGTKSALDKQKQGGYAAICTEMILAKRKQIQDAKQGLRRILPILLTHDIASSFPPEYERFNTITDWRVTGYVEGIKKLLLTLYGLDKQGFGADFNQKWDKLERKIFPQNTFNTFKQNFAQKREMILAHSAQTLFPSHVPTVPANSLTNCERQGVYNKYPLIFSKLSDSQNNRPYPKTQLLTDFISGTQFSRHAVSPDGDCGYTAFGITRTEAHQRLSDNLTDNRDMLRAVVAEQLLQPKFVNYLIKQGIGNNGLQTAYQHYQTTTGQASTQAMASLQGYASDLAVLQSYLNYDVRDRRIDNGWAHPAVLQLLAHIQGIELYIWRIAHDGQLLPHDLYPHYEPANASQRADLLFVNGNHFERLEKVDYTTMCQSRPKNEGRRKGMQVITHHATEQSESFTASPKHH